MIPCTIKGKPLVLPWGRTPRLDSSVRACLADFRCVAEVSSESLLSVLLLPDRCQFDIVSTQAGADHDINSNSFGSDTGSIGLPSTYAHLGNCDHSCQHCDARFWYEERIKNSANSARYTIRLPRMRCLSAPTPVQSSTLEEIANDAKVIEIENQLLVLIKRQVETELMLEEKFKDLCEKVSNFVKEIEDVVKEVERLSCKDVAKKTVCLLRRGQKRELYMMMRLHMMVDESHLSVREKHTFVSKMNLGRPTYTSSLRIPFKNAVLTSI
uniref:Uncharacterized protein n=1 Tax=Tanacetum cinerariifolium TaxID=118510 RepID=A0A6L2NT27_TANCI|nr:hypothetical protein [Tanacetum cinerariifolium]